LKALEIKRENYYARVPNGKLQGKVEFANEQGVVNFDLTEEDSIAILKLCAARIQERVAESAKAMYLNLEEHTKLITSTPQD